MELPLTTARERTPLAPAASGVSDYSRGMTALVIEPDEVAQRQLMGLLAATGYRVVPVANADTGLELAQRIKIDAAFCSVHAPGLNWVELSERMQARVGGFILLSDGYDAELAANFEGYNRYVLAKPVQEAETGAGAARPGARAAIHQSSGLGFHRGDAARLLAFSILTRLRRYPWNH